MARRSSNIDWGGRYPPGAANDPMAPYNQPDPPQIVMDICSRWGWDTATAAEWLDEHYDFFGRREPPEPHCSVCNPRPREHKRVGFVFCDDHDREDLQAQARH